MVQPPSAEIKGCARSVLAGNNRTGSQLLIVSVNFRLTDRPDFDNCSQRSVSNPIKNNSSRPRRAAVSKPADAALRALFLVKFS